MGVYGLFGFPGKGSEECSECDFCPTGKHHGQIDRSWGHVDHTSPRLVGWKLGGTL